MFGVMVGCRGNDNAAHDRGLTAEDFRNFHAAVFAGVGTYTRERGLFLAHPEGRVAASAGFDEGPEDGFGVFRIAGE